MNFLNFTKNQFVQESSFHGISHLRYSKSKARIAFWIFLTFLGICYTGFEISREIIRISSGVKFETTYRSAQINEIQFPQISYCYSNPFDILDWRVISESMANFNWTTEDVGHLLSVHPFFDNLEFKTKNVSIQHAHQLTNTTSQTFISMYRITCHHQNERNRSAFIGPVRSLQRTTCILIDCQPDEENYGDEVASFILSGNNMGDELAMKLRQSIINFMWKVQGLHLDNSYEEYIYSPKSIPALISLRMNTINAFSIDPIMVNMPTTTKVICRKTTCEGEKQKPPCSNYHDLMMVYERGIDCFEWEYKIRNMADVGLRFWNNVQHLHEHTMLVLLYPSYEKWRVRQHMPLSLWYQTLSNIGGTLSIWTGASLLSLLHLLEVVCYMCYKRKWKVGNSSQIAQSVV